MKAIEAARYVIEEAREGIAWIAFYRVGKGWDIVQFWGDVDGEGGFRFDEDDLYLAEVIAKTDEDAILVNTYYHNFGEYERITQKDLADCLRWHYHNGTSLLRNYIR